MNAHSLQVQSKRRGFCQATCMCTLRNTDSLIGFTACSTVQVGVPWWEEGGYYDPHVLYTEDHFDCVVWDETNCLVSPHLSKLSGIVGTRLWKKGDALFGKPPMHPSRMAPLTIFGSFCNDRLLHITHLATRFGVIECIEFFEFEEDA